MITVQYSFQIPVPVGRGISLHDQAAFGMKLIVNRLSCASVVKPPVWRDGTEQIHGEPVRLS